MFRPLICTWYAGSGNDPSLATHAPVHSAAPRPVAPSPPPSPSPPPPPSRTVVVPCRARAHHPAATTGSSARFHRRGALLLHNLKERGSACIVGTLIVLSLICDTSCLERLDWNRSPSKGTISSPTEMMAPCAIELGLARLANCCRRPSAQQIPSSSTSARRLPVTLRNTRLGVVSAVAPLLTQSKRAAKSPTPPHRLCCARCVVLTLYLHLNPNLHLKLHLSLLLKRDLHRNVYLRLYLCLLATLISSVPRLSFIALTSAVRLSPSRP